MFGYYLMDSVVSTGCHVSCWNGATILVAHLSGWDDLVWWVPCGAFCEPVCPTFGCQTCLEPEFSLVFTFWVIVLNHFARRLHQLRNAGWRCCERTGLQHLKLLMRTSHETHGHHSRSGLHASPGESRAMSNQSASFGSHCRLYLEICKASKITQLLVSEGARTDEDLIRTVIDITPWYITLADSLMLSASVATRFIAVHIDLVV